MEIKLYQRGGDRTNFELYKKAIQFYADELIPKTKQKDLLVTVHFIKFKDSNECGCTYQKKGNHYKIQVNKDFHFPYTISTLAHEMVHVKQGVSGKFTLKGNIGFIWNGKMYKDIDNLDAAQIDQYNNMPWEKEAYTLEPELTKKFFKVVLNDIKEVDKS